MNQSPNDTFTPVFIPPYSIVALAVRPPARHFVCRCWRTWWEVLSKTASLCCTELIIILPACMMEQQLLLLVLVPLGDCHRTPCLDWPLDCRYLLCICVLGVKSFWFVGESKNKGVGFIAFYVSFSLFSLTIAIKRFDTRTVRSITFTATLQEILEHQCVYNLSDSGMHAWRAQAVVLRNIHWSVCV